jgi:hypothetical protein
MVPIMSAAKPQLLAVDNDPAILDLLRRGLAIPRDVAESHSRHVTVRNSTLGGAKFEIRTPLEPKFR